MSAKTVDSSQDVTDTEESQKSTRRPVKRTASGTKRKAESSATSLQGSDAEDSQPQKKAKVAEEPGGLAANGQPTNKVLPVHITFPPKEAGMLRLATWNICGLGAASKKVRRDWLRHISLNQMLNGCNHRGSSTMLRLKTRMYWF